MMHNPKQFYLDFVYEEYMKSHSSFSYILTLFDFINWSIIPSVKNPGVGRTGYSPVSMIKALLFKIIKGLPSIPALIDELYSNPYLAQAMGFDPIRKYVPSESTFSLFRKSFDVNIIYSLIADLLFRGISAGFISTEFLAVDSFPIVFNSHFNNPKSFKLKSSDFKSFYSSPLDADFGVKPVSNDSIKFYDKKGNPKKVFFYLGYKAHVISFLNIPIFTIVTPASVSDSSIFNDLLKLVMGYLEFTGSKVLADKGYDSSKIYDFVHLVFDGTAFIPLRSNSTQDTPKGKCGTELSLHSHYFEKARQIDRSKFVCPFAKEDRPDSCSEKNCYAYKNFSKDNFRHFIFRNSDYFKNVYSKRTNIESLFARIESILSHTKLRSINSVSLEANLINLFFITSAFLAHSMGRDDLISSISSTRSNYIRA